MNAIIQRLQGGLSFANAAAKEPQKAAGLVTAGKVLLKIFKYAVIVGLCYQLLYPVIYMLSMAFRPPDQVLDPSVVWIPKSFTLQNFSDALEVLNYGTVLGVTARVAGITAVLQCVASAFVGYGFARFRFKERNFLFALVILTLIVPPQTILIPLYFNFRFFLGSVPVLSSIIKLATGQSYINLIGSDFSFYLPGILGVGLRGGLYIFIFRQFFRGMPRELEDAALIDGCGPFATFARVMIPNAGNVIITVLLFSLVWNWNDYFLSSNLLGNTQTLSVSLSMMKDNMSMVMNGLQTISNPLVITTRMQAGCLLSIAPLLIFYILLQRFFTESIERSGIVG